MNNNNKRIRLTPKDCTICYTPSIDNRCSTCNAEVCNECYKRWVLSDGGVFDETGKLKFSCPSCRTLCEIPPAVMNCDEVKSKLFWECHETMVDVDENGAPDGLDGVRNILTHGSLL